MAPIDTRLSRRSLIGGASLLACPGILRAQGGVTRDPFQLGVASGDPAPDGFVIWTRLAPLPLEPHGGLPMVPIPVEYDVAEDERFNRIVKRGHATAWPELAHAVHVEIEGLRAQRAYFYRFTAGRYQSAVGRGLTCPPAGTQVQSLSFVAAGCQHYQQGLYSAYRHIAAEDVDFVWHYGDYIYEGRGSGTTTDRAGHPTSTVRRHLGDELFSLDDYRLRYAQYKMDPDLQAAHAAHSWWVTWDDHEIRNNWAAGSDPIGTPAEIFDLRRQAAVQAYYEHMPLRRRSFPVGTGLQIFRNVDYGDLLRANFLDTRQFRTSHPCGDGVAPICAAARSPEASMLGLQQEQWLFASLSTSQTRWNLLANQVMMMSLDRRLEGASERVESLDTWSGYAAARDRLLTFLQTNEIRNVVIVTGDEHQHFSGELRSQGAEGDTLAVEFVATSISSGGDGTDFREDTATYLSRNPHLQYLQDRRGYVLSTVNRDVWHAECKILDQVSKPGGKLRTGAAFAVERGRPGLRKA